MNKLRAHRPAIRTAPLSHERLAILLALAGTRMHRAELADKVIADSIGSVAIKSSTLYVLLKELHSRGYIQGGPVYDLTPKGWRALQHELPRLERQVRLLQVRLSPRQYLASQPQN